jgi:hypothetical protein
MIRDPVAAYASAYGGQPPDLRRAIRWGRLWLDSAAIGLQRARTEAKRHKLVRYEDVTADPHSTIAAVADFVGVPFEESAMLGLEGYEHKENSSFATATSGTYEGAIRRRDGVDRHAAVHPHDRSALAAICGSAARALGYELERRRPSVAVALARLAEDARPRHRLRRLASRLS